MLGKSLLTTLLENFWVIIVVKNNEISCNSNNGKLNKNLAKFSQIFNQIFIKLNILFSIILKTIRLLLILAFKLFKNNNENVVGNINDKTAYKTITNLFKSRI